MGIGKIYAVARGEELLARLKQLAPNQIETFSNREGQVAAWVKQETQGVGADLTLDTLGAVASLAAMKDAMHGVRRGGRIVNIGGTAGELGVDVKWWMDEQMELIGSVWFTAADGIEMANMVRSGVVDLSVLEPMTWPLDSINEAINGATSGNGGGGHKLPGHNLKVCCFQIPMITHPQGLKAQRLMGAGFSNSARSPGYGSGASRHSHFRSRSEWSHRRSGALSTAC